MGPAAGGSANGFPGQNGNGIVQVIEGDVREHIGSFIEDCGLQGMSPETIRSYRSNLRTFALFLSDNGLVLDTGRTNLESFLHHLREVKGLAQATLENYFAAISSFFDFLIYRGVAPTNPVLPVRRRYLRTYKKNGRAKNGGVGRKVLSVEEMARLVKSIVSPRDRALVILLAKTGVRRGELIAMDVGDVNWVEGSIELKDSFAKRSNRKVFFDGECARVLRRWVEARNRMGVEDPALFVGVKGERLKRNGVYSIIAKHAAVLGFHDPKSERTDEHFSVHNCRYWFSHHLLQSGMRREMVQELRGDQRRDAIDIYDRISPVELREAYFAHIPQLGI